MVFSSLTFLFLFLPLAVIPYYIWNNRTWRNGLLLVLSLFFYAWGEPKYVVMMVLASLIAYLGGLGMEASRGKKKKIIFLTAVALVVLNLLVFKYTNFFWDNLSALFSIDKEIRQIALPIGISFYTFQILSYVIDLYFGRVKLQRNFFHLLLYVSFFPQLIAGPIVRYSTIEEEILHRKESWEDVEAGLKRFILGLAKKVLLANNAAAIAEIIYTGNVEIYGTAMYWLAAFAYTMQIYFDFSGYSDMAIGLGRMFGFHFLENFNYPYVSRSATEFWRRWHISLSSWFRDYVYIPLGGSRVSRGKWVRNILVVWGLTGFWHGAEWNFILWGLYYAALLVLEKFVLGKLLDRLLSVLRWLYAFFVVNLGWVLFNLVDFSQLAHALHTMFVWQPTSLAAVLGADSAVLYALLYLPICFLLSFPVFPKLPRKEGPVWALVYDALYGILFLTCVMCIVSSVYNPFIYFRF
ncbi:MAG: MBOAT family protein [Ruminiclostridium sp.]|nr:MBOAT family protein [Ruminiclostridium sp.]